MSVQTPPLLQAVISRPLVTWLSSIEQKHAGCSEWEKLLYTVNTTETSPSSVKTWKSREQSFVLEQAEKGSPSDRLGPPAQRPGHSSSFIRSEYLLPGPFFQYLLGRGSKQSKVSPKCDTSRRHASDWLGGDVTRWVITASPSQTQNGHFLNLAINIAMVPESDAKLQAEQRVYHWLNVRLCCSILHTNYITGCCCVAMTITTQVRWYSVVMKKQSVESWRASASWSEWVLMETWVNTLLHEVLISTNKMGILHF